MTSPPPSAGAVTGMEVTDLDAVPIGRIVGIYPVADSSAAQWAAVALPGSGAVVLVPLGEAIAVFGGIQVPYRFAHVQYAPTAPTTEMLSEVELIAAIEHYRSPAAGTGDAADRAGDTPFEAGGETDGAELVIIRSEEQLRTGVEAVPVRRLRLRKYIVTEERTITVQLRHEEFRIEQEPIPDPGAGTVAPSDAGEVDVHLGPGDDRDVTMLLYAERPLIGTEVVPVERMRVSKYVVSDEQTVSAAVRREVVEQVEDPS